MNKPLTRSKSATDVELVTPEQWHAEGGPPKHTQANWRSRGQGPKYVKIGRAVRYTREALAEYYERHTVDPKTAKKKTGEMREAA